MMANASSNVSWPVEYQWACLTLGIIPVTAIFGNVLVVLAILTQQALKTSTNLLLLSLSVADLLVAVLIMPFGIYLAVSNLRWHLSAAFCAVFMASDVTLCTASIVHLMAISFDRFFAVVKHTEYHTHTHSRRIKCILVLAWMFSVSLGLPLGIILRTDERVAGKDRCEIDDPNYMLYGSIFAFYIPSTIMVAMYSIVFCRLRARLRAVKFQEKFAANMVQFSGRFIATGGLEATHSVQAEKTSPATDLAWAAPLARALEETVINRQDDIDEDLVSVEEVQELTTILIQLESSVQPYSTCEASAITLNDIKEESEQDENASPGNHSTDGTTTLNNTNSVLALTNEGGHKLKPIRSRSRNPVIIVQQTFDQLPFRRNQPTRRLKNLKRRATELLMRMRSKQRLAIRKEARATKLVSTVLIVFLVCWLPFFTMNLAKVHILRTKHAQWTQQLETVFIAFTWLGYLNSSLNPIIYSLINRRFRKAFRRILCCQEPELMRRNALVPKPSRMRERRGAGSERNSLLSSLQRTFGSNRMNNHSRNGSSGV